MPQFCIVLRGLLFIYILYKISAFCNVILVNIKNKRKKWVAQVLFTKHVSSLTYKKSFLSLTSDFFVAYKSSKLFKNWKARPFADKQYNTAVRSMRTGEEKKSIHTQKRVLSPGVFTILRGRSFSNVRPRALLPENITIVGEIEDSPLYPSIVYIIVISINRYFNGSHCGFKNDPIKRFTLIYWHLTV